MVKLLHHLTTGLLFLLATHASPTSDWTRRGPGQDVPTADIKNGSITGVHSDQYNQDFFLGVPYAQPPVGEVRFRNPQSLNNTYAEPLSADHYSPDCQGYGDDVHLSEDCLYLNVIRPSGYGGQALPVAVWNYGGGLRGGGAAGSFPSSTIIKGHTS
jgi:carboxylesterase type B